MKRIFRRKLYDQVIFYGSIVLIIIVATYGYKKIKSKLDQINQDLEELRKFEQESDQGKED